jgi:hypothetical protein
MYYLKGLSHQLRLALNYYGWIGNDAYEDPVWKRNFKLRLIFSVSNYVVAIFIYPSAFFPCHNVTQFL